MAKTSSNESGLFAFPQLAEFAGAFPLLTQIPANAPEPNRVRI